MEREDGEMSDDGDITMVDVEEKQGPFSITKNETECTVLFKPGKDGIVVKTLEKADASKLEERAKRFGLNLTGNRVVTQKQIDELYTNVGIESGNERHFRFDTILLSGVDGLTTREIFEYLEDYKPISLEWIDCTSCNIVCQDHISAALALLVHSREIKDEELNSLLKEKSRHHWRQSMPHPKKDFILMRFATNGDKKNLKNSFDNVTHIAHYDQNMDLVSKNPWGDLCKTWGVYDNQEIYNRKLPELDEEEDQDPKPVTIKNKQLAMRLGKRTTTQDVSDSDSDSEWRRKSKTPRMRMHADEEESRQKKKKHISELERAEDSDQYKPLSIEVVNSRSNFVPRKTTKLSDKFKYHSRTTSNKSSILSRLGSKVLPQESLSSDESDSDYNVISRVQKVGSSTNRSSVWSRLNSQPTNKQTSTQSDLRKMLTSKKHDKADDLRGRLGKTKHLKLRIEVDNN